MPESLTIQGNSIIFPDGEAIVVPARFSVEVDYPDEGAVSIVWAGPPRMGFRFDKVLAMPEPVSDAPRILAPTDEQSGILATRKIYKQRIHDGIRWLCM